MAAKPVTESLETGTRARLRRGLRIATLVIAAVIVCGLGLAHLLDHLDRYEPPGAQLVAFGALVAVLAGEAVLLSRRRPWGNLRFAAIALILAAAVLSYATLPEGRTSTTVDWMFGAANWAGLVVLLDRPPRTIGAFLLAHELTAILNLVLFDEPSRDAWLRLATGSVNVVGYPLCVAMISGALGRVGLAAARAERELERTRTEEAIAAESHRRRQRRFEELADTTVPLLTGLADGSLPPTDTGVKRRCAIEAARMRRLFAQVDVVDDPLLHELRNCADVADRKGVEVELDTSGRVPELPPEVRRELTEAALTALATAESCARVTVAASPELVSLSVVADCGALELTAGPSGRVLVETFHDDELTWMEATWTPVR